MNILEFFVSKGLAREIEAVSDSDFVRNFPFENFSEAYSTLDSYYGDQMNAVSGQEFRARIDAISGVCTIIDYGAGPGYTSSYIAGRGHHVTAVEPVPELCRIMESVAGSFKLDLRVCNSTAEETDAGEGRFDVAIFNSSLHHCDDPVMALKNAMRHLKPNGMLMVINEPLLHAFRSKGKYFRLLEECPEEMNHYGGNEHIYRHNEYLGMIRAAGFDCVVSELNIRDRDREILDFLVEHDPQFSRRKQRKILRFHLLRLLERGGFLPLVKKLSLLHTTFMAVKPAQLCKEVRT